MALTQTDRTLLRRCFENQENAWHDFVERFLGLFIHVIRHTAERRGFTLSQDDIDDLSAEIMLSLLDRNYEVLRRFRGQSSLAAYLTVIARRIAVRRIMDRKRAEAMGHVLVESESSDAAMVERVENAETVQQMLDGLSEFDAQVVRKYHLEGLSYKEISTSLGIPENSVGPTLHRARKKLRANAMATTESG